MRSGFKLMSFLRGNLKAMRFTASEAIGGSYSPTMMVSESAKCGDEFSITVAHR
jgi:hypothetical protein